MQQPSHNAIIGHHIVDAERIAGTNDLWLASATRAVKNPGKGDYRTVLIGPRTKTVPSGWPKASGHGHNLVLDPDGGYALRGDLKLDGVRFKVLVGSPQWNDKNWPWVRAHSAEVFATDFATARRILITLAKELVYDR